MPLTTQELRAAIAKLPRYPLAHLPTPFEHLTRFSKTLGGPQIYIKRDDCTGLVFGGNKARHHEFLIADALAQKADIVVWGAGVQSNNCRQMAAACAKAGLDCHLVLGRGYHAYEPDPVQGNLLIDHIVGAHVEIVDELIGPELEKRITAVADKYKAEGRKVFSWDSRSRVKPLAAVSYALCLVEIVEQATATNIQPAAIYGSSAGSTGAGLALGHKALGLDYPIRYVAPINWPYNTRNDMAKIAVDAAKLIGVKTEVAPEDIDITFDYIGPGYGLVSEESLEAIALLARTEGILLDPTYSGKAMAGLIDDIRQKRLSPDRPVVFIHTGGTPALFAYNNELAQGIPARRLNT